MSDPETVCKKMIGGMLLGIQVEDDVVRLNFNNGFIEIEGEDYDVYIEPTDNTIN